MKAESQKDINHVFHMIQLLVKDMSVSVDDLTTKADAGNRITKENSEVLHGLTNALVTMQAGLEKQS